jgi:hypothetical protein
MRWRGHTEEITNAYNNIVGDAKLKYNNLGNGGVVGNVLFAACHGAQRGAGK